MKNLYFTNFIKQSLLLLVFALSFSGLHAQLTGTKTVLVDYPSIDAFVIDLNAQGVGVGGVTLVVPSGYSETAPVGGFAITATGTAGNPIQIVGGGLPQPVITANAGLTSGALNDAIFKLIGSDYVTIANLELRENALNTTTAAATNNMTEWGIALLYASLSDGAQNNQIVGNTIVLNRTYLNTFGIYSNTRHSSTAVTTSAEVTSASGSNSFNTVYGNTISNVNYGIVFIGAGTTIAAIDNGNDIGGTSISTGNIITNWGGGAALSGYISLTGNNYCIFVNQQINDNISFNTIISGALTTSVTVGGILKNYTAGQPTGTISTTINNNTVTLSNNPTATTTGGLIGINNQGLSPLLSTATMSMNNNTVQNCVLGGSTSTTNGITGITNLSIPGTLNISNNNVVNNIITATTATTGQLNGISNSGASGTVNMNNNIIRNFASTATSGQIAGIINSGAVVTALNINNNQLGNATGGFFSTSIITSGNVFGISSSAGASTCVLSITGNDIRGISHTSLATGGQTYIVNSGATLSQNISNNTFTNLTANTTGSVTFISNSVQLPANGIQTINSNSIVTAFNKTGAGGTVQVYLASTAPSSPATATHTANLNNFSNITVTGATTIIGWSNLEGAPGPTKNITNNTFSNWVGGSSAITAIATQWSGNTDISNNTISNISGTSAITGISYSGSNGGTTQTCNNNTITSLISSGTGGTVLGITGGSTGITTFNVTNNTINGLSSSGASSTIAAIQITAGINVFINNNTINTLSGSGATSPLVRGINVSSGTAVTVRANKIYSLSVSGAISTTNGAVTGVLVSGGTTVDVYNNVLSLFSAPTANLTDAIRGIAITSTTATTTYRLYYNTVYINATSTGTTFGTTGIFHAASGTATTAALDMRNNIIINESTPNNTTGLTVAYRRSSNALGNYSTTSNRNKFYAGIPGPNNLIFTDGTTPQQTFTGFQTAVGPTREANSFTGEAFTYGTPGSFFISLTGASADFLKPVAGITTQVESGALNITTPLITDGILGVIRAGNIGYTGTGTNPDLGAYEFEGISPAPSITLNSVTPPASTQCTAATRLVSVTITTPSGSVTGATLNYSFNGTGQTPIVMTNTSGNIWEGTIPVASPLNATVAWSITANNSLPLASTYNGATYADEPLFGFTASANASSTTVCSGSPSDLTAILLNPAPAPAYSAPPAVSFPTTDEDLGNITITQGATTILNNTSAINTLVGTIGTAAGTAGSYSNFTSFGPFNLNIGQTYDFSVSSIQFAGNYGNAMAIYIDYNRNGVFTDAGELVYTSPSLIGGPHTRTGSFVVPLSASSGLTRMRVISNEGLISSPTQAVSYGEYEEYTINLIPTITSVTWNPGAISGNPATVNPTTTTTYTATITSAGCVYSPAPTVMVTVNPLPTAPTATNSAQCGTQVPTASVTSTTVAVTPTFKWYDAAVAGSVMQASTSTTYTSNVASTTTFYVSEVDGVTLCESPRTAVTVTVASADGIAANTSASTICIGSSVTLTASNTNPTPNQSYSYTWSGLANSGAETPVAGSSVMITPLQPGSYTYDLTGVDGLCNAFTQISITVNPFVASITAIDATCNGVANGSFSLAGSSCGTMPYTYSVDAGPYGAIPTNLAAGSYSVTVQDFNGYISAALPLTITQPSTTITNPTVTPVSVCQNDLSAMLSASATTSVPTAGSLVVPFNVLAQPTETNAAPGNIVSTATFSLPANATITGGTLNYNGLTAIGSSWMSDIRLGLSGNIVNTAAAGTGSAGTPGTFNYVRTIPVGAFGPTSGTVNLLYWDFVSDNAGDEATFPTGAGVATLTINYTVPTPATISWWDASTNGSQIGTGSPFETVGTSVLPTTATPGIYTFYAQGQNGACPSPGRTPVNVTVKANSTNTITATACNSYSLNAQTYTTSGIYTQTLTNAVGCDSIITLNLTINYGTVSVTNIIACDSYTWTNAVTYTASGTFNQVLTNAAGCDSIATLNLTINNSNTGTAVITACNSYTWIDGITYTASTNTPTFTLTNAAGCDSVVTLNLTIGTPNTGTAVITACNSFTWIDGITYTASTSTPTYTLSNAAGCDSIVTLNLTINNSNTGTAVITACDSYTWIDGITYTANNNTAMFTLTNAAGCDSIVTLNLTINNSTTSLTTATSCDAYTWTNAITYTMSGIYTQTLTNAAGCDSIATLNLTINNSTTGTDVISACNSYTWIDGNTYTASTNTPTFTLTNAAGCDSVVTLILTISSSNTGNAVISACNSYTWIDGITYTASNNTATYTLTNVSGCDSIVTLNLTINTNPVATAVDNGNATITASAGTTYQWINCATGLAITGANSQTFAPTVNGSYQVTVTNAAGCSNTSSCVVIDYIGIKEIAADMISVYPNPTRDFVTINMTSATATIEVIDAQGKLLQVSTIENGEKINLSDYVTGIYIFRIKTDNGTTIHRISKN